MPSITITPDKGVFPLESSFTPDDSGLSAVLEYSWVFGDGKTSSEETPEHTYYMPGVYNGTFSMTDDLGVSWNTTFVIYVYDWELTDSDGINVSFPDKCYRIAIEPKQGVGIVPWGIGGNIPFPEAMIGTVKGVDKAGETISLILDNRSGRFYRIGVEEVWLDKIDDYGVGAEINTMVRPKEHIGINGEDSMIEHVESHIHVRPSIESYKGQPGYTDKGFRDSHRVNLKIFANGDTDNPLSTLKNVSQYGEYVYGKRVENKRLQLQIETTTSAFRITRIKQLHQDINKVTPDGIGGIRSENEYQRQFRGMDLWITRDSRNPLMNRATGIDVSGSYDSLVTGPDSISSSAIDFLINEYLTTTLSQKQLTTTLSFWLEGLSFSRKTCTAAAGATDVITCASHGFSDGDYVGFIDIGNGFPGEIIDSVSYYIGKLTNDTFRIYTSLDKLSLGEYYGVGTFGLDFDVNKMDEVFKFETPETMTLTCTAAAGATDVITCASHGFSDGDSINFIDTGNGLPGEIVAGVGYYTGRLSCDTFRIYTSLDKLSLGEYYGVGTFGLDFDVNKVTPTPFVLRVMLFGLRLTNNIDWTQDVQIEWDGIGWVNIAVSSDLTNLYVYENGVLKGITPVPVWLTTYGGNTVIAEIAGVSMYDIRRIPRQVVSDALLWYYDDVINNGGNGGLLPIMR